MILGWDEINRFRPDRIMSIVERPSYTSKDVEVTSREPLFSGFIQVEKSAFDIVYLINLNILLYCSANLCIGLKRLAFYSTMIKNNSSP